MENISDTKKSFLKLYFDFFDRGTEGDGKRELKSSPPYTITNKQVGKCLSALVFYFSVLFFIFQLKRASLFSRMHDKNKIFFIVFIFSRASSMWTHAHFFRGWRRWHLMNKKSQRRMNQKKIEYLLSILLYINCACFIFCPSPPTLFLVVDMSVYFIFCLRSICKKCFLTMELPQNSMQDGCYRRGIGMYRCPNPRTEKNPFLRFATNLCLCFTTRSYFWKVTPSRTFFR